MTFLPFASITVSALSGSTGGFPKAITLPPLTAISASTKPPGVQTSPFFTSKSSLAIAIETLPSLCENLLYDRPLLESIQRLDARAQREIGLTHQVKFETICSAHAGCRGDGNDKNDCPPVCFSTVCSTGAQPKRQPYRRRKEGRQSRCLRVARIRHGRGSLQRVQEKDRYRCGLLARLGY